MAHRLGLAGIAVVCATVLTALGSAASAEELSDQVVAEHLADFLRSARTVISQSQSLINDPSKGDKGLTGDRVVAEASAIYKKQTGEDPAAVDPASREGRLLGAQMKAVRKVMSENAATINAPGVGFKGFIPAIFARLVNEDFQQEVDDEAEMKVTAPEDLVRNRKALPDAWELSVLNDKFAASDWPKGQRYSETVSMDGRQAFRLMLPEYYKTSCLTCHGGPKGEMDITGYPKEGGKEGDLGAAISVTLFH